MFNTKLLTNCVREKHSLKCHCTIDDLIYCIYYHSPSYLSFTSNYRHYVKIHVWRFYKLGNKNVIIIFVIRNCLIHIIILPNLFNSVT